MSVTVPLSTPTSEMGQILLHTASVALIGTSLPPFILSDDLVSLKLKQVSQPH